MKKSTSLLLSGILVSGMVLGTIITPTSVQATDGVEQTDNTVTNNIIYSDREGQTIATRELTGTKGSPITAVPDGVVLVDGSSSVFGQKDGLTVTVNVTQMISVKVNFVDQNGKLVKTETVNGGDGNKYTLDNLPEGCTWPDKANKTITLESGKEYNIPVDKQISNTVIFKTSDNAEVGRVDIFGDKVGDEIDLTSGQIPTGYTTDKDKLALQTDGNTQIVTVTKAKNETTPFIGVVRTNSDNEFTDLYTVTGESASRALDKNTDWQTSNKMVLNGVTYYQVSTDEWVKADDISVVSQDNNSEDTNSDIQKTDKPLVTTKDVSMTLLYTKDGKNVENRGLGANTPWVTDQMHTLNGVKYYRVATNEWVKASDVK